MELKEFNKLQKPWEYNFEFECGDEEYMKLDALERYFIYKITPDNTVYEEVNSFIDKHRSLLNIYDADGSGKCFYPLIHSIYKNLWGWERSKETFGRIDGWEPEVFWGSDTMNSVQTVFDGLAEQLSSDNTDLPIRQGRFSFNYILECWLLNNMFRNRLNRQKKFKDYLNAYHTLGNFVLVPAGFNAQRGTSLKYNERKINDYWDLSLKYLKENGYGEFDSGDFNKYINYFFLWDYVDENYNVKPLSPENNDDINDLKKFFETAKDLIERRGKFMTAMLDIRHNESDLYTKIQAFLTEGRFESISNAAKKIIDPKNGFEDKIPETAKELLGELEKG